MNKIPSKKIIKKNVTKMAKNTNGNQQKNKPQVNTSKNCIIPPRKKIKTSNSQSSSSKGTSSTDSQNKTYNKVSWKPQQTDGEKSLDQKRGKIFVPKIPQMNFDELNKFQSGSNDSPNPLCVTPTNTATIAKNIRNEQIMKYLIEKDRKNREMIANQKKELIKLKASLKAKNQSTKRFRKSRKALTVFDYVSKQIGKKYIFRIVKYVKPAQLESWREPGSMGYFFWNITRDVFVVVSIIEIKVHS